MSARDEPAYMLAARYDARNGHSTSPGIVRELVARIDRDASALKAVQPRAITTAAQLEALPFGSAVQTSDECDTVVLKCEGGRFRNQSGADLSVDTLWRFGTKPLTVIFEATP